MKVVSIDEYHEQVMRRTDMRDFSAVQMPGGLVILAEDNRPLYEFRLYPDGSLEVRTSSFVRIGEVMLDNTMSIIPRGSNEIVIQRPEYK